MLPTVSIIGLGWLGEPLAEFLQEKGYRVRGSVTSGGKSLRLSAKGITNRVFGLYPQPGGTDYEMLFDTDILFVNIAPSMMQDPGFYPQQIAQLKELIHRHRIPRVLFTSSTSIYPDKGQVARETDPLTIETTGSQGLFRAEQAFRGEKNYQFTVIRLGGLIGYDRVPGRHFAGKEQVAGHPPVNYIHRDDALRMISWVFEKELWEETFNGIAPLHPSRKEVYERNAALLGFDLPASYEFPERTPSKEVSAGKIAGTGFLFKYPDPLDFYYVQAGDRRE